MKKNRVHLTLVIVIVLVIAVAALVHFRATPQHFNIFSEDEVFKETMARVDADRDGRISRSEWLRYRADESEFNDFDMNNDGFIDLSEFKTMFATLEPPWMR